MARPSKTNTSAGAAAPRRRQTTKSKPTSEVPPPPPPVGIQNASQPSTPAKRRRRKPAEDLSIKFVVGGHTFTTHEEATKRLAALQELSYVDSLAALLEQHLPKRSKATRKLTQDLVRAMLLSGAYTADSLRDFLLPSKGAESVEPAASVSARQAATQVQMHRSAAEVESVEQPEGLEQPSNGAPSPPEIAPQFGAPPPVVTPPPFGAPPPPPFGPAGPSAS